MNVLLQTHVLMPNTDARGAEVQLTSCTDYDIGVQKCEESMALSSFGKFSRLC